MNSQLIQLVTIQFLEFFRKPGSVFWSIFFPVIMAWGLGSAFSGPQELTQGVAVIDKGNTKLSHFIDGLEKQTNRKDQEFYARTVDNGELGLVTYKLFVNDWDNGLRSLKRGEVSLIMEARPDTILFHFDPLNTEAQLTYLQLSAALENYQQKTETLKVAPLTQIGNRYIDFLIPGLIGMNIMMSVMWGVSYGMIDKRMRKLLRRLVATPMKRSTFLTSILIGRVFLVVVESSLLLLFSYLVFDVHIQGSVLAYFLMILSGVMAFTGIAIFVSSRTSNTQAGNGLINLVVMPMMIVSGVFFSYHNFPDLVVSIIELLPLTMLVDSLRAVFIEGASLQQVMLPFTILASIGFIFFSIGLRIYKWY